MPIFAALLAAAVLGEFFGFYHLIAIVMVFAGISVFEYQKNTSKLPAQYLYCKMMIINTMIRICILRK